LSQPLSFTSGLNNLSESQIKIFPNPSSNFVTVESELNEISTQLFDINGRLLHTNFGFSKSHTIDLARFKNGIYYFEISDGVSKVIKQLIKE
jgi:Secretion system C-terminal sorting domain